MANTLGIWNTLNGQSNSASNASLAAIGRPSTFLTIPGIPISSASTLALTANQIRYQPFYVLTSITVDQINVEITTASGAGSTVRCAIYNADVNLQPTSLIIDGGTLAADSIGVKTATINNTLSNGRYLLAINSDSTPTLRVYNANDGYVPAAMGNQITQALLVNSAYAAYAGTGVQWTVAAVGTSSWRVFGLLRISAFN